MGVNGAGKSTLLKLIAGASQPDSGSVAIGASVKMGYFAQHAMELLDGDDTIFESLEGSFPQAGQGSLRALAGCFGFSGDDVEKRCRFLSGGEKARLVMAKMLYDPPNFLVLDEPTNHLDIATKEMLITALAQVRRHHAVRQPRPPFPRGALQPRAGADARGCPPLWRRLHRIRRQHRPGGAGVAGVRRADIFCPDHAGGRCISNNRREFNAKLSGRELRTAILLAPTCRASLSPASPTTRMPAFLKDRWPDRAASTWLRMEMADGRRSRFADRNLDGPGQGLGLGV
jgi:hypothetical protein